MSGGSKRSSPRATPRGSGGGDADGPEREPRHLEEVGFGLRVAVHDLSVCEHHARADHGGGEVLESDSGSVGSRGSRAGDRLAVDVSLVVQRHPEVAQRGAERGDPSSGENGRLALRPVDLHDAGEGRGVEDVVPF